MEMAKINKLALLKTGLLIEVDAYTLYLTSEILLFYVMLVFESLHMRITLWVYFYFLICQNPGRKKSTGKKSH